MSSVHSIQHGNGLDTDLNATMDLLLSSQPQSIHSIMTQCHEHHALWSRLLFCLLAVIVLAIRIYA